MMNHDVHKTTIMKLKLGTTHTDLWSSYGFVQLLQVDPHSLDVTG